MGTYVATCTICERSTPDISEYHDWVCPHCGQVYEYIEGHSIVLDAAQLELLRQLLPPK